MKCLEVEGLCKSFQGRDALIDLHFQVSVGEVFGLVGPDGAGKTTLLRILAGLMRPDMGKALRHQSGSVGYISQRFSLYRDLSVSENVDFFARVYGLRNFEKRRDALLDQIGLLPFRARLAEQLSGGMKQKLALCCSLIHQPSLLLMDEPTTGVDPVSRREFWGIVFHLQKEGLTVLSSTPYMDEAEQFDRLALLHEGRVLRLGTAEEIRHSVPGRVYQVLVERPYEAREALRSQGLSQEVELFGDSLHVVLADDSPVGAGQLEDCLKARQLEVRAVRPVEFSMEDVFLKVAR